MDLFAYIAQMSGLQVHFELCHTSGVGERGAQSLSGAMWPNLELDQRMNRMTEMKIFACRAILVHDDV